VSLFSIIVPTFNRAGLLREALDSIFAQEFKDYEIIVVEGGSSDETPALLAGLGVRVRVVEQREKQGPGAARNAGCRQATGEYITFLDCDDLWFPWTLGTFAEIIQRERNPAWVMGRAAEFKDGSGLGSVGREPLRYAVFEDYLSSSRVSAWVPGCCMAIRREAFERVGGFTNACIGGEDSDLELRLGTEKGFVQLESPMTVGYREHSENTMKMGERLVAGMRHMIRAEMEGAYPGGAARARERWRIITRHVRPVSKGCLAQGRRGEGWELYRACLRWHVAIRHWKYLAGFPVKALVS
jgi:glycosyltransferase involved in cell wall biosynthesis